MLFERKDSDYGGLSIFSVQSVTQYGALCGYSSYLLSIIHWLKEHYLTNTSEIQNTCYTELGIHS